VGLLNAIIRFDPSRKAEFVAFAVPTIMGEVRRHFRDCGWAVKVPRQLKDLQRPLAIARDELSREGRAPTATQLANCLGVERETVVEALIAGANYSTLSSDMARHTDDDESCTISGTLGELDLGYDKVIDSLTLRRLIAALPERDRTILALRFFGELTQTQIAQRIGCSQMHVSRLLAKAIGALREKLLNAEKAIWSDQPASPARARPKQSRKPAPPRHRSRARRTALAS
jgi:RNA polymerase sigma-B factor